MTVHLYHQRENFTEMVRQVPVAQPRRIQVHYELREPVGELKSDLAGNWKTLYLVAETALKTGGSVKLEANCGLFSSERLPHNGQLSAVSETTLRKAKDHLVYLKLSLQAKFTFVVATPLDAAVSA